ncbi:TetR/AcrR family transcriptional regulator [Lysinibacillus macroides]|uniref:HTH tetR-type domain-containing protein n=1 Tax=Lysinibacillus macroides TaxID=33935 RepID=A0A0M9DMI8_9BACI|nr:TetR/AcrR family transcriptional regulator [Lysinibacillus macroides]KOY83420.1 hypothetical protein ADM90_09160 [Lysinibacillus macroides]QPR69290.1 TetR/AcrR family transcriptional regulator [Lysinibacillus macroides]
MARKKVEDELTKEMIVEEADRQFLQQEFQQVSMRAIAKALGCSHGAIYYHFQNKSDLFHAVIEKYFAVLNHYLDEALQENGLEGTKRVLLKYMEFGLNFQSQYELMFAKRDDFFDPLLQQAPNASYEKFSATLQALHSHQLKPIDIYATFMALHGFVLNHKGRVKHYEEAQQAAQNYCDYLVRALVY